MKLLSIFIILLLTLIAIPVRAAEPIADAAAEPASAPAPAAGVLNYLRNLEGEGVIVGQFGMFGTGSTAAIAQEQLDAIFNMSGHYPAITGADFNRPDKSVEEGISETVTWLDQKWHEGYLVTASWHTPNPCGGGGYKWPEEGERFPLAHVLPGGDCRSNYLAQLDQIAAGLLTLQNNGVVVLWRPFHEMNGPWFWWGAQPLEQYVQLWQDQHQYFAEKGLTNLLWVYSPNIPWDQWAIRADYYYPGDAYADIVALDKYMKVSETVPELGWGSTEAEDGYQQLARIDKPMMLAEFGPVPASGDGADSKSFNWGTLPEDLHSRYPRIVAFVAWEYIWQIGRSPYQGQQEMMVHLLSITREDLPSF